LVVRKQRVKSRSQAVILGVASPYERDVPAFAEDRDKERFVGEVNRCVVPYRGNLSLEPFISKVASFTRTYGMPGPFVLEHHVFVDPRSVDTTCCWVSACFGNSGVDLPAPVANVHVTDALPAARVRCLDDELVKRMQHAVERHHSQFRTARDACRIDRALRESEAKTLSCTCMPLLTLGLLRHAMDGPFRDVNTPLHVRGDDRGTFGRVLDDVLRGEGDAAWLKEFEEVVVLEENLVSTFLLLNDMHQEFDEPEAEEHARDLSIMHQEVGLLFGSAAPRVGGT